MEKENIDIKLEDIIISLLREFYPQIEPRERDRRIILTCIDDLRFYVDFYSKSFLSDTEFWKIVQFLLDYDEFPDDIDESVKKEVELMLKQFINEWWNKFQERVQVILNEEKWNRLTSGKMNNNQNPMVFSSAELEDLILYLTNILVKNGERCFLRAISEAVIKQVASTEKDKFKNKILLMQRIGYEVQRVAKTTGVLVFMLPDFKTYKLREWRDEGIV